MLHQVGVSFNLYYDARKEKLKHYFIHIPMIQSYIVLLTAQHTFRTKIQTRFITCSLLSHFLANRTHILCAQYIWLGVFFFYKRGIAHDLMGKMSWRLYSINLNFVLCHYEWTTPDSRNTPSTTNLEEEETVDAPENDGNASMPEQVNRPNPCRKKMMMIISLYLNFVNLN